MPNIEEQTRYNELLIELVSRMRPKLVHALTQYDIKESTKRGYNRYAMAQYFAALDEALTAIANGDQLPEDAFRDVFNEPLKSIVWKVWVNQ